MINFYTVVDGLLESTGTANEVTLIGMQHDGVDVHRGHPPGFTGGTPFAGARWHVEQQAWVDTNAPEQQAAEASRQILANRHGTYPPMADFIDAYYWQARGDSSRMEAYLAACDEVKQRFPKA